MTNPDYKEMLDELARVVGEVTDYTAATGWPKLLTTKMVLVQFAEDGMWLDFDAGFKTVEVHTRLLPLVSTNDAGKGQELLSAFIGALGGLVGKRMMVGGFEIQAPMPLSASPISTLELPKGGFLTSQITLRPVTLYNR